MGGPRLSADAEAVLAVMIQRGPGPDGLFALPISAASAAVQITRDRAYRALYELRHAGVIERVGVGRQPHRYRVPGAGGRNG